MITCKNCKDKYSDIFKDDFKNEECLPCSSQREFDKYCEQESKELQKYNKKHGKDYTDSDLYYEFFKGNVDLSSLVGFPKLRSIFKHSEMIRVEIERNYTIQRVKQLTLNLDTQTDHPF